MAQDSWKSHHPNYLCARGYPVGARSSSHHLRPLEVGIIQDLPVPALLRRDWLGFDKLLASKPPASRGVHCWKRQERSSGAQPALMATESERQGESESRSNNLFLNLYQQMIAGGSFSKEQREDDQLRNCWLQV